MKKIYPLSFIAMVIYGSLLLNSCNDEELTSEDVALIVNEVIKANPKTVTDPVIDKEDDKYASEGSIVAAVIENTSESTTFLKYFENDIPLNVDTESGSAFTEFNSRFVYKNQIFTADPLSSSRRKLAKMQVNKETGLVEVVDNIILTNNLQGVRIINDNTGVFTISKERRLFIFDPSTMRVNDVIDLPNSQFISTNDDNHYINLQYRKNDNRIFLSLYTDSNSTPAFYDATTVWVEVINLNTRQWEKTISYDNAQYPIQRGADNNLVDEEGNVYILCQGSYGLDGKASLASTQDSRPQFLKIPAGKTDFDPNYSFNPVQVNNPLLAGNFSQFVTGPVLDNEGNGYAAITTVPDAPRVLELLRKFATNTITPAESAELRLLVFSNPTSKWAKLNFDTQSVEILDIPVTAAFAFPMSHRYGDEDNLYFSVFNPSESINAIYEYSPETNSSNLLYNVTSGGQAINYIKLTK